MPPSATSATSRPSPIRSARPSAKRPSRPGDRLRLLAEPQVDGPGELLDRRQRGARLLGVGRRDDGDAGLDAHDPRVLERVVRDAVVAVVHAAADADDAHRQLVQDRAVAHELVAAHRGERGDRVDVGRVAGLGEAGRDADHVLLGDAGVPEAVGVALGERLEHGEAEIAGEQDDPLVASRRGRAGSEQTLSA